MIIEKIGWNRANIDAGTLDVANKIYQLASGLTYDQFTTAIQLALEDMQANYTLVLPSVPQ